MTLLDEIVAKVNAISPEAREELNKQTLAATKHLKWIPNPGPQTDAYYSLADVLLYGGEPGGGKSQLILGLSFNCHQRSLIMRRQYGDLERLIDDALKIHGSKEGFNGSPPPRLRMNDHQRIDFRAAQRIGDEQNTMGQGRDLLGIDEATHFAEQQVRFLMGWVRTETPGQRCRTVLATNPPLTAEGLWVVKMFMPWLDKSYPKPAKPGELRWVVTDDEGNDEWVSGPEDVREIRGKVTRPLSRTYIPASVKDNPYYTRTDYERQLDAMSEPYRSLLMGGFKTTFEDAPNQCIPTAWVVEALKRWTPTPPEGVPMCAMGVDCSGGGNDPMIIAPRHDWWFAPVIEIKGRDIPMDSMGKYSAGVIVSHRRDKATVVLDMGGGFGGPAYEHLKENDVEVVSYKGAEASNERTADRQLKFFNKRSQTIWRFREALDPNQAGGSRIALPDDPGLVADLTAPTFEVGIRGIAVENKKDVCDRLGRSTDRGDAVVMCWNGGPKNLIPGHFVSRSHRRPQVITKRSLRRR